MKAKSTSKSPKARSRAAKGRSLKRVVSAPIDALTENQICQLKRDNLDTPDYWLNVSPDHVCLTKQRVGEPSTESMNIPRKDFNRLARWYVTGKVR